MGTVASLGAQGAASNRPHGTWKARPTVYHGIQMRSRLEALWAAEWDQRRSDGELIGWQYEPKAFATRRQQYLPDFRLDYGTSVEYVEVKPGSLSAAELYGLMDRMATVWYSEPNAGLVVVIGSPVEAVTFSGAGGAWAPV